MDVYAGRKESRKAGRQASGKAGRQVGGREDAKPGMHMLKVK